MTLNRILKEHSIGCRWIDYNTLQRIYVVYVFYYIGTQIDLNVLVTSRIGGTCIEHLVGQCKFHIKS